MGWNQERIDDVAIQSAPADYGAFEAIGLSEWDGARVLDVGCFDGYNTVLKFAPYEGLREIVGVDPDAEALGLARKRSADLGDGRFSWMQASFEDYDGEPDSFDLIYFGHSFQHLPDKAAAARKAYELLAPGGFAIIKTVDDSTKISSPDPDRVMERLLALFETEVRPHREHLRHTDYYNGAKCYELLRGAGFDDVAVQVSHGSTVGKGLEERLDLFDRMTYFRRVAPEGAAPGTQEALDELLTQWRALFEREDYYFDASTFVWIAQKPWEDTPGAAVPSRLASPCENRGGLYHGFLGLQNRAPGTTASGAVQTTSPSRGFTIEPMVEEDLGAVMDIELRSFPDPWTPVAYAMELRHNPRGLYRVARDGAGRILGYIGWWYGVDGATIANVAVDPSLRRSGVGRALVEEACQQAVKADMPVMQLQVREANGTARGFYAALGFDEVSRTEAYYTNPDDNAIIMVRPLGDMSA